MSLEGHSSGIATMVASDVLFIDVTSHAVDIEESKRKYLYKHLLSKNTTEALRSAITLVSQLVPWP